MKCFMDIARAAHERAGTEMSDLGPLYKALAEAQAEMSGALKENLNPHFKNKYANLESVWEAWQKVGPKHGLCLVQLIQDAGDRQGILLTTILGHTTGASLEGTAYFPAIKSDAQQFGSACSYARRYCLAAMVGIVQTDDDGESDRKAQEAESAKAKAMYDIVLAKKSAADKAFSDKNKSELENIGNWALDNNQVKLDKYVSGLLLRLE